MPNIRMYMLLSFLIHKHLMKNNHVLDVIVDTEIQITRLGVATALKEITDKQTETREPGGRLSSSLHSLPASEQTKASNSPALTCACTISLASSDSGIYAILPKTFHIVISFIN